MIDFLGEVFKKELALVGEREKNEPDYLPANDFQDCKNRAFAGLTDALEQVTFISAVFIAEHREQKHGEDHSAEIKKLKEQIKPEYLEEAINVKSWWNI